MNLKLRVTAVMPYVGPEMTALVDSAEALLQTINSVPEGEQRTALEEILRNIESQRENLIRLAQRDMAHVEFLEDGIEDPLGVANFIVDKGQLEDGATYNITLEKL